MGWRRSPELRLLEIVRRITFGGLSSDMLEQKGGGFLRSDVYFCVYVCGNWGESCRLLLLGVDKGGSRARPLRLERKNCNIRSYPSISRLNVTSIQV